jgi:hypothetical protein
MTLHYHGTPITPNHVMLSMAGRCFCVSFYRPDQVELAHQIGQSVMLDNGAFSAWKQSEKRVRAGLSPIMFDQAYWGRFHAWADIWLAAPNTWAVIPDVIGGGSQEQDALIREWPHGERGAPVWHMDEPVSRLLRLLEKFPRVCIGSTAEYRVVLSPAWVRRMDQAWNEIAKHHRRTPTVHMLRGMQLVTQEWPFASVDSTDIAQNHNRPQNAARLMADRWDAGQAPAAWACRAAQTDMLDEIEA